MENLPTLSERWQYIEIGLIAGGKPPKDILLLKKFYFCGVFGLYRSITDAMSRNDQESLNKVINEAEDEILRMGFFLDGEALQ